jgi:hypothetical protein
MATAPNATLPPRHRLLTRCISISEMLRVPPSFAPNLRSTHSPASGAKDGLMRRQAPPDPCSLIPDP